MKKQFSILAVAVALFTLTSTISSCEKDAGKAPNISFKTTTGYTYTSDSIDSGTPILVGINASKSEDKDVLKTFNIQHTFTGRVPATDTTISTLSGGEENSFSKDFILYPTGTAGQNLKYTFTVTNRDGITGSVSFTKTIK